ncbi:MAG: lipase maturation factor family protein [bacterium]|nr:lipase maturation factor family protein [bacterium]
MTAPRPRGRVRDLFLRCLGALTAIAFASLWVQLPLLLGSRGLSPACEVAPRALSLLRFGCSDALLAATAAGGVLAGLGILLGLAPRLLLPVAWLLYLSLATVGGDFLSFQWDNLLLETLAFALLVAPRGWRPRGAPSPHPVGVFLMQWLCFRLHVESGAAKLLLGDPGWRDLTAMIAYWETAPLPTWLGWWAHQLPETAQKGFAAATYVVELGVPFLLFGPRLLRPLGFLLLAGFQLGVAATANYGFFNWLSLATCLWLLDDDHLAWLAARAGRPFVPAAPRAPQPLATAAYATLALVVVPLSLLPFSRFVGPLPAWAAPLVPVYRLVAPLRSLNAYHLFASMTYVRDEVVLEGSDDGVTWREYEWRWKPGDPARAPAFVQPHQPRADFQAWFLLLGARRGAPWFDTLLGRMLADPAAVASLWAHDPFDGRAPAQLRVAVYRYRFTDRATRAATGRWWERTLEGTTTPRHRADPPPG